MGDQELRIADPESKKPEDWDEEEDGEWEAPVIDNPECKIGCGKYDPPMISNPAYKGKWYAPKIDNPAYIGVWKPRQIENPNYFYDESPYILPTIDSVGIDIWTMNSGIVFDNIVISNDIAKAEEFAERTFKQRQAVEELQTPKPKDGYVPAWVWETIAQNPVPIIVAMTLVVLFLLWFCCLRGDGGAPPPPAAKAKAAPKKEKKDDKKEAAEDKDEGEKKDD